MMVAIYKKDLTLMCSLYYLQSLIQICISLLGLGVGFLASIE